MPVTAFLVSAAAFGSAFLGAFLSLRAVSHVGMIIAIGAGIRIGAAFFDLIPEAMKLLGGSINDVMLATAFGFLAFYVIEKFTAVHVGHEAAAELDHGDAAHRHVGVIGAGGLVIAAVVVIHRFSDGISVVGLLMANRTPPREVYRWVAIVAIAPVFGILLALVVTIPDRVLGALLAVFAGFFLYVGAAELLPEAHRSDRSRRVVLGTLGGIVAIYLFSLFVGALG